MLRSIGKTAFAYAYNLANLSRVLPQPEHTMPFIVCYHRVVENFESSSQATIPSMLISTRMLERQLDWLAKRFTLLSLDEITHQLESGRPFDRPAAAITFDDGYADDYHHAYPLLKRKGIPAAFFVVTGLVDSGKPQIFDRLYLLLSLLQTRQLPMAATVFRALQAAGTEKCAPADNRSGDPFTIMTWILNRYPQRQIESALTQVERELSVDAHLLKEMTPLTWDMLKEMHRGGMTIGSHTHSHLLLTAETIQTAESELIESKRLLESHLGKAVKHFAYPDGRFNPAVVDAVRRAGYGFAYSICRTRSEKSPLLTIPRKVLWERACLNTFGKFSSAVMNCHAHWVFDMSRGCEHDHLQRPEQPATAAVAESGWSLNTR